MTNLAPTRCLPGALLVVIGLLWLLGMIDAIAISANEGWGKVGAGFVLCVPILWPGQQMLDRVRKQLVERRPWAYVSMALASTWLALLTLALTRLSTGSWIHPSWF